MSNKKIAKNENLESFIKKKKNQNKALKKIIETLETQLKQLNTNIKQKK